MAKYIPWVYAAEGEAPPPPALVVVTATLPAGVDDAVYPTTTLVATGGTPPYTWTTVAPNNLPTGLSVTSGGVVGGTPTSAGTTTVVFRVTDSLAVTATSGEIELVVVPVTGGPLMVLTNAIPDGDRGVLYPATTLVASGGTPPYTWALVAPYTLPTGMSLSTAGVITGTPSVAGPDSIIVRVTDAVAATDDSGLLTITIDEVPGLNITTNSPLPQGTIGTFYTRTFVATGGWGAKTWSKLSGDFPSGLTLTSGGVLSGTPTTATTSNFTLQVADSEARTTTKTFSMTVVEAGSSEGPHDYYLSLLTYPELAGGTNIGHWSMRTGASLDSLLQLYPGFIWSYSPGTDTFADAQDAARFVMAHNLDTGNQPRASIPWAFIDGEATFVVDFFFGSDFHTTPVLETQNFGHKLMNFLAKTPNGDSIYIEPRVAYKTASNVSPALGPRDLRTYTQGNNDINKGPFNDFGIIRTDPYQPTGLGAPPVLSYIQRQGVWNRDWFHIRMKVPGNEFTDWNATYSPTTPLATSPILGVAIDGADTILTVNSGQVDATTVNWWSDVYIDPAGSSITITGNSNPALNGVWDIEVIDYTHLAIRGTALTGTGGTASKNFVEFTWWHAEEDVEHFRMYYKIPLMRRLVEARITQFIIELNTSSGVDEIKGFFILEAPTLGQPSVLNVGVHDFVDGDFIWITGCITSTGPHPMAGRPLAVTVVDSTHVSVDLNVTATAIVNPPSRPAIFRLNFNDIGVGDSFTLEYRANITTTINYSADMSADIDSALTALTTITSCVVNKISDSVYDVEYDTGRNNLINCNTATGFTYGGTVRTQVAITGGYYAGTFGRANRTLHGYARNIVMLRDYAPDEEDGNFFKKPVR